VAHREYRAIKSLQGARAAVLRRVLKLADHLLLCFVEFGGLQRRSAQLRGDQSDYERQVLLQAFRADLQRLLANRKADFGADIFQFVGDRELIERLRATVEHHAGKGWNRNIARSGHRIARGQHAQNHDHILHRGPIGDQIDAVDLRTVRMILHVYGARRSDERK